MSSHGNWNIKAELLVLQPLDVCSVAAVAVLTEATKKGLVREA